MIDDKTVLLIDSVSRTKAEHEYARAEQHFS